jgi:translation elongation factor EF-1alpha
MSTKLNINITDDDPFDEEAEYQKDEPHHAICDKNLMNTVGGLAEAIMARHCPDENAPLILSVDFVEGVKFRGTLLNHFGCAIDTKEEYVVLPRNQKVKIAKIHEQPMAYKYEIENNSSDSAEEDRPNIEINLNKRQSEPQEESKGEDKNNEQEEFDVFNSTLNELNPGDVIVGYIKDKKPIIDCSQRLLVEFFICADTEHAKSILVSKGFQFEIRIHSFVGTATFESIDGHVEVDEKGKNNLVKSNVKLAKAGEKVFGKIELSSPIAVANYTDYPALAQFIARKDGHFIGVGIVNKHVPI